MKNSGIIPMLTILTLLFGCKPEDEIEITPPMHETIWRATQADSTIQLCVDLYEIEDVASLKIAKDPKIGRISDLNSIAGCFRYKADNAAGVDTFQIIARSAKGLEDTTTFIINISKQEPEYFSCLIDSVLWEYPYPQAEVHASGRLIIYAVNPFFANGFNIVLPSDYKKLTTYTITNPDTDGFGVLYSWNALEAGSFNSGSITIESCTDKYIEGKFEGKIGISGAIEFKEGKFRSPIVH